MSKCTSFFFEGKGKPLDAAQKGTGELGPEERGLVEAFKSLNDKDKKFAVALLRKMAKENKAGKRSG